jgi:hypothetical protein
VYKKNTIQTTPRGHSTLSTGASFAEFISDFFPSPDNNYGNFIYAVFRSGDSPSISPKRSGIHWIHATIPDLVWIEQNLAKSKPHDNKNGPYQFKKIQGTNISSIH